LSIKYNICPNLSTENKRFLINTHFLSKIYSEKKCDYE
jgi:hypothetical protein